jgi:predicted permease
MMTVADVLKTIADDKSLILFNTIVLSNSDSDILISTLHQVPQHCLHSRPRFLQHHSLPSSILGGLFGKASSAIAITAVAYTHLVVPTVVILESARIRARGASTSGTSSTKPEGRKVIIQSLINAGKAPYVWAPAIALVIALLGIPVPSLINSMLSLIGQASAGVALFVGGLMLAAHKVKVDKVVSINTLLKSFGEPLLMLAFMLMFGLTKHGARILRF